MYNILECKIDFKNNQLYRVTVLVEISRGDIRAIFVTTECRNGYMHLEPNAKISNELLQEVAGYGLETMDRDKIFPNAQNYIK